MYKRIICLLFSISILLGSVSAQAYFPDVDNSNKYEEAISWANKYGIMIGDENGRFHPHNTVTRAEMAAIVCRAFEFSTDTYGNAVPSFSDVPSSHWAYKYITKLAYLKILQGYSNGKFGPNDPVTYEQVLTMILRVNPEYKKIAESKGGYPDGYLSVAKSSFLLKNISSRKGDPFRREEVAQVLYNGNDVQDFYLADELEIDPTVDLQVLTKTAENYLYRELDLTKEKNAYVLSDFLFSYYDRGWLLDCYMPSNNGLWLYFTFYFFPEKNLCKLKAEYGGENAIFKISDYNV